MNNKPIAWMNESDWMGGVELDVITDEFKQSGKGGECSEYHVPLYTNPHPDNLGLAESIIKQQQLKIDNLLENNARLDAEIEKLTVALRVSDDEYFKLKGMYDDCK